ncbi:stalk domain-containing protein [Pseudobacteroides cellulosolvens]|uniref:Copper amine oxidase-like domain-containing protein n=1 Tax=Pseudobacteroides cellulosolvens ATCC 35603 = DSM 2933 TaxID=398512 RepID=A0A0L6JGZ5_9FIRM|nr:stalk domain-containing protein [Pseudobacteroides cellulosolvens]KNY25136.1 copper amine oxidase-like domain-containing protein [Pseudobacteroides cellulosolvens ATCC 35603 = DSM 2933]
MKKRIRMVNLLTLVAVVLAIIVTNVTNCCAAQSDAYGFIKVAGAIGLKSDGSLWSIPQDDGQKYSRIADGYLDIDTDKYEHSYIALKKDGTLWVWGKNSMGQFALNNIKESEKPIKILDNVKAISGLSALKKDGSLWAWGGDVFYEKESKVNKPVFLYGGVKSIAYGSNCIYVIDNKSTLYAIRNYYCGSELSKGNKVKIAENVKFAANNCYITNDNKLWEIMLTQKDIDDNPSVINYSYDFHPRLVLTNVVYTDSNDDTSFEEVNGTSCAIKDDGSLWVWNMHDMPYGTKCNSLLPQKLMTGIKYAKCGVDNVKIIKNDGSVCFYGFMCPKSIYSIPKLLDRNIIKVYDDFSWVLTKDDTLIGGLFSGYESKGSIVCKDASKNVKWDSSSAVINKPDGGKIEYTFENGGFYVKEYDFDFKKRFGEIIIKNDNTMWEEVHQEFGGPIYKKIDIDGSNIKWIYSNFDYNMYILNNDATLWVSFGKYIPDEDAGSVEYQPPVKLLDDVKDLEFKNNHTFAITNSGDLYGWNYRSYFPGMNIKPVKKFMNGVDSFDRKTEIFDIIKKDKSHWNLRLPVMENNVNDIEIDENDVKKENEDFYEKIAQNAYKDIDNMEGLISYSQYYYIKENGELWVRGFGDISSLSDFNQNVHLDFGKVMDNVVSADHDASHYRGLALCKDGSLWEYGMVLTNEHIMVNQDIAPRKVMEDVKEFKINCNSCAAVKKDGSLYVWGDNQLGQMGNGTTQFVEKPQKILDNVDNIFIGYYSMTALKKDGVLMGWGRGFYEIYQKAFVNNPIRIEAAGNKIYHTGYEAVGVGEDIDVQVKINDAGYTKSVKLVLAGGQNILLDKCYSGYFIGRIPEIKKAGSLKYHIVASDDSGNEIKSKEYNIGIVKNDNVLMDSQNGEFIAKAFRFVIDGKKVVNEYSPLILIKNGRTLVPVSAMASLLKAEIKWDEATKTVNISKNEKNISIRIGSREVAVGKEKVNIDMPAIIVYNQTMLPLRSVCELLGAEVSLDAENQEINIKLIN